MLVLFLLVFALNQHAVVRCFDCDLFRCELLDVKDDLKLFLRKVNSRSGLLSGKAGPPGPEVRVPEEGGGRQRGQGGEELVSLEAHAEVLVQETRGPVPLVPPVTEHQRYDRHLCKC